MIQIKEPFDSPLLTLSAARDQIRLRKSIGALTEDITIWISGGVYEQEDTFELNYLDSGTEEIRITWKACKGEKVRIIGGKSLSVEGFKKVSNQAISKRLNNIASENVLEINLKEQNILNYGKFTQYGHALSVTPAPLELFFDDKPMQIARYPNEGSILIGKVLDAGSVPRISDYSNRGGCFILKILGISAGQDNLTFGCKGHSTTVSPTIMYWLKPLILSIIQ